MVRTAWRVWRLTWATPIRHTSAVRACRERLEGAIKQGQLRADVDLDDVVELLYAPLYYRMLLHTRPITPDQVDRILELAFTGIAARRADAQVG
ncbi:TetR-like C-terminal domain-containing protein [Micromonospora sp. CPCC 206061]|uniref:TetR-like C-terminal domain-containing protein n=1 Tax=Micromonospora sp. CPCC 206061 TaxID=3122410 RepID=UPI002FEEFDE7